MLAGLLFGVTVYGVMNAIVVPLSASPPRAAPPSADVIALGLMAHAFFGVALSLVAARILRGQAA